MLASSLYLLIVIHHMLNLQFYITLCGLLYFNGVLPHVLVHNCHILFSGSILHTNDHHTAKSSEGFKLWTLSHWYTVCEYDLDYQSRNCVHNTIPIYTLKHSRLLGADSQLYAWQYSQDSQSHLVTVLRAIRYDIRRRFIQISYML